MLKSDNTQLPVKRIPSVHKMISIGQWYFDKHKYYSDVIKFYKKDSTKNSIRSLTNVIPLFQTLLNERIRSFSLGLQPKKKQHFFSQCWRIQWSLNAFANFCGNSLTSEYELIISLIGSKNKLLYRFVFFIGKSRLEYYLQKKKKK